jgi:peptide/nickel transport system permease protein
MLRYGLRRLILMVPLLMALSVLTFFYIFMIPGDPVAGALGPEGTAEQIALMRHELGLDRPVIVQFVAWAKGAIHGDLGISFVGKQKITPVLIQRIPATLELALGGFLFAVGIGLPAGFLAGRHKNSRLDYFFSLVSLGGLSMPNFWLGTLLVIVLGIQLDILPTGGYVPFSEDPLLNLKYLLLPAFTLGIDLAPFVARMTRASVIETIQEPFIAFARAKGLREKTILVRYIIRHSICTVVVVLAMYSGHLLAGSLVLEELFLWPGMGRLFVGSVKGLDYYIIQACILIYATIRLGLNLVSDLTQAALDPRIQLK